jgi:hypothetical protein
MNIPSHFSIRREDYDSIMKISVAGKDRQLIFNSVYFELDDYSIVGTQPDDNLATLDRFLLFKKKPSKDIDKTDK